MKDILLLFLLVSHQITHKIGMKWGARLVTADGHLSLYTVVCEGLYILELAHHLPMRVDFISEQNRFKCLASR